MVGGRFSPRPLTRHRFPVGFFFICPPAYSRKAVARPLFRQPRRMRDVRLTACSSRRLRLLSRLWRHDTTTPRPRGRPGPTGKHEEPQRRHKEAQARTQPVTGKCVDKLRALPPSAIRRPASNYQRLFLWRRAGRPAGVAGGRVTRLSLLPARSAPPPAGRNPCRKRPRRVLTLRRRVVVFVVVPAQRSWTSRCPSNPACIYLFALFPSGLRPTATP